MKQYNKEDAAKKAEEQHEKSRNSHPKNEKQTEEDAKAETKVEVDNHPEGTKLGHYVLGKSQR